MTATIDQTTATPAEGTAAAPEADPAATPEAGTAATPEAGTAATPAARPAGDRLYAIDVLRFVAAAAVVGYHFIPQYAAAYNVDRDVAVGHVTAQAFRYGNLGVDLFFIISGFVICMSSWGRSVGQFLTARITRLAPAYLLSVLLASTLLYVWWRWESPSVVDVLANLTMVQGFLGVDNMDSVYWTLLVELKFYLLFMFVVHFGVTYRRVVVFCTAWTITALVGDFTHNQLLATVADPASTYLFVGGITLYLMYRFGPNLLLWGMLAASWIFQLALMQKHGQPAYVRPIVAYALITAFFLIMLAVALRRTNWIRWRFLATVGALTYPLYLIHGVTGNVAVVRLRGTLPGPVLFACIVAGLLLASWLIHRLVERPLTGPLKAALRRGFDSIRQADREADHASRPSTKGRDRPHRRPVL